MLQRTSCREPSATGCLPRRPTRRSRRPSASSTRRPTTRSSTTRDLGAQRPRGRDEVARADRRRRRPEHQEEPQGRDDQPPPGTVRAAGQAHGDGHAAGLGHRSTWPTRPSGTSGSSTTAARACGSTTPKRSTCRSTCCRRCWACSEKTAVDKATGRERDRARPRDGHPRQGEARRRPAGGEGEDRGVIVDEVMAAHRGERGVSRRRTRPSRRGRRTRPRSSTPSRTRRC